MSARCSFASLALVMLALLPATPPVAAQTVVLVRHAEKVDDSADPPLSEVGEQRARALARALEHADVRAIFVTQYRRTLDTALPLAEMLELEPRVVRAIAGNVPEHARQVAAAVMAAGAAGTVVVIGHSNTVPAIIAALGGPDVGAIGDDDYHDLFVLQATSAAPLLIRSRY